MKRILCMVLALVMFLCLVPAYAEGAEGDITVYLSVSRYGEIVESGEGELMAYVPVSLSGDASYNLDDVFAAAHRTYYPEGEAGYASSTGEWGLGVDMFWGDTSYNFGYQVNGGNESVMGLEHQVEDGDYIDACIYQNLYPDTEGYARFDRQKAQVYFGQALTLSLTYASGYDENWNMIFSPCEGASIYLNGEETACITDENGAVNLSFDEAGTYVVSARKSKLVHEEGKLAITAPVCVVTVKETSVLQLIHGIAGMYAESNLTEAGSNLPWILADMAIYEELFSDSAYCLSEEKKEACLSLLVEFAKDAEKPGDLAKTILALHGMGYDAQKVYTADFKNINPVKKLIDLAEAGNEAVTNIYTLPYVIMALSQTAYDGTEELIRAALESKTEWQDVSYGTDAITPMIWALAPYMEQDDAVRVTVEESVAILKSEHREDGLIDGFEGYEAASTGLAVCALSAAGIDSAEVICGDNNLIDGLLSVANADKTGFPNAFATEQGFRGLLAWCLLDMGKPMYDFSDYPKKEINFSVAEFCPVKFDVLPRKASIAVTGFEEIEDSLFDLPEGEYTYEIKASDYWGVKGRFEVGAEDAENHALKIIRVSLERRGSEGGGGVLVIPSAPEQKPEEEPEQKPEQEPEKPTDVSDVFSDVAPDAWYCEAVQYAYEKGLFQGTGERFEPDTTMTRAMLVTVLYRLAKPETVRLESPFTDVPENTWFAKSVAWAADSGVVAGVSEKEFAPDDAITREQLAVILYRYAKQQGIVTEQEEERLFLDSDDISDYAKEAMRYAVQAGILNGKEADRLCPGDMASRAEVAMMLMRFAEAVQK